jgi:hypothetical protein
MKLKEIVLWGCKPFEGAPDDIEVLCTAGGRCKNESELLLVMSVDDMGVYLLTELSVGWFCNRKKLEAWLAEVEDEHRYRELAARVREKLSTGVS